MLAHLKIQVIAEQREIKTFESVCGGTVEGPTGLYECGQHVIICSTNFVIIRHRSNPVSIIVVILAIIRVLPYIMSTTGITIQTPKNRRKDLYFNLTLLSSGFFIEAPFFVNPLKVSFVCLLSSWTNASGNAQAKKAKVLW